MISCSQDTEQSSHMCTLHEGDGAKSYTGKPGKEWAKAEIDFSKKEGQ